MTTTMGVGSRHGSEGGGVSHDRWEQHMSVDARQIALTTVLQSISDLLAEPIPAAAQGVVVSGVTLVGRGDPPPPSDHLVLLAHDDESAVEAACVVTRNRSVPGLQVMLSDGVRWQEVHARAQDCFTSVFAERIRQDLFDLADGLAVEAGGAVAIEDPERRVLAFSTIEGQPIDEVRRQGILGRQVPEHAMRDDWYRTLWGAAGVEWFKGEPHQDDRIAVALREGDEVIGSVWIVGSPKTLHAGAIGALEKASALITGALLQTQHAGRERREQRVRLLARFLRQERRLPKSAEGCVLVAVESPRDADEPDLHALRLSDMLSLRALRESGIGLAGELDGVVYAIVPIRSEEQLRSQLLELLHHAGMVGARIAISPKIERGTEISRLSQELRLLLSMAVAGGEQVRALADHGNAVAIARLGRAAETALPISDGVAYEIRSHDLEHGTDYVRSLSALLRAGGEVTTAAEELHLHPNSLRYRRSRAIKLFDLAWDDPDFRLLLHLQLRLLELDLPA